MRAYLLRVTAAALGVALVQTLVPKGAGRRGVQLGCALVMVLAVLSPVLEVDEAAMAKRIADLQLQTQTAQTGVEVKNRALQARIISETCRTYICSKAESLGVELEVEVETKDIGSGPYPYSAVVTGLCSAEAKAVLTRYMEENLAIPEERQTWQSE